MKIYNLAVDVNKKFTNELKPAIDSYVTS